jgi:hypothetical protein
MQKALKRTDRIELQTTVQCTMWIVARARTTTIGCRHMGDLQAVVAFREYGGAQMDSNDHL